MQTELEVCVSTLSRTYPSVLDGNLDPKSESGLCELGALVLLEDGAAVVAGAEV